MTVLSQISGGYDSVAVLIKLLKDGYRVKGIFFNIEQKYIKQEREAVKYVDAFFKNNENYLGYEEIYIPMKLTRNNDGSPSDYIPIRNLVFGAVSANYALSEGFSKVAVGNKTTVVRENDPWSFSDCSVGFYESLTNLVSLAAEQNDAVEFIMPLLKDKNTAMSKGEVLNTLLNSGMDITKLWSCYEAGELPCGECYHCKENIQAFKEIGVDSAKYFK